MKIKMLKKAPVPMKDVKDGDVFRYKDEIYIRFGGQTNQFNCLLLESGILCSILDEYHVEVLDAELIIKN